MTHFNIVSSIFILLLGCKTLLPADSSLNQFFENSRRRPATDDEKRSVMQLDRDGNIGCTAFFVENTKNKAILGTARHCTHNGIDASHFSATRWCLEWGYFVASNGSKISCSRIIAADHHHDIVLLEANMPAPAKIDTYQLASYVPKTLTRLKMIGFPVDQYAPASATVTENCWVLEENIPSPYDNPGWQDRSGKHNCSTYGGNSGGPLIEERGRIVVGLPFTYQKGQFANLPQDDLNQAAYFAQMADFVATHRKTLENEGIVIAATPSGFEELSYLSAASYWSEELPTCTFKVYPLYMTSPKIQSIRVYFECADQMGILHFNCTNSICLTVNGEKIQLITQDSFDYYSSSGHKAYFTRR